METVTLTLSRDDIQQFVHMLAMNTKLVENTEIAISSGANRIYQQFLNNI